MPPNLAYNNYSSFVTILILPSGLNYFKKHTVIQNYYEMLTESSRL